MYLNWNMYYFAFINYQLITLQTKVFFVFVCSDELTLRTNLYQLAYFCRWYLHKNDILFVFTSSCLYEGSCLLYVIYVCLRIVVSNTYCVMFLFWLSLSCVLCTLCCQFLWIVHFWLPLRFIYIITSYIITHCKYKP